jgi:hypothetical protein
MFSTSCWFCLHHHQPVEEDQHRTFPCLTDIWNVVGIKIFIFLLLCNKFPVKQRLKLLASKCNSRMPSNGRVMIQKKSMLLKL